MLADPLLSFPARGRLAAQMRAARAGTATFALILILSFTIGLAGPRPAQSASEPARSTMSGVYNAAQAVKGEEVYMGLCVSCHPAGTYVGEPFTTVWGGRPLSDLFGSISRNMPKQDPGSLTPEEYAQVIAYLLRMNDVPAGKTELPTDDDTLKAIRIETPSMRKEKQ